MPYISGSKEQEDGQTFTILNGFADMNPRPYQYKASQDIMRIINRGNKDITVNVNSVNTTINPGRESSFNGPISQFTISSSSGIQSFTAESWNKSNSVNSGTSSASSPMGNTFVFWGDSITNGYTNGPNGDTCYALYASLFSSGKIRTLYNAGISGQTTTQILARFATDVLAYKPAMCAILAGTNDITAGGITLAGMKTNLESMITQCQSNGITPILCTIPPAQIAGTNRSSTTKWNIIIRATAQKYKLSLVDMYSALADPATGGYKAAFTADNIHPSAAGALLMGQTFANQISPLLPNANLLLPVYSNDGANALTDGLFFTDTTPVDGLADSWTKGGAGTGTTALVTNDTTISGNWQELTKTVNDTNAVQIFTNGYSLTSGTSGWNRGDKVVVCCRIKAVNIEAGGLTFNLKQAQNNVILNNFSKDGDYLVYIEQTLLQGDSFGGYLTLTLNKGTGTVRIAQAAIYNLTALGL